MIDTEVCCALCHIPLDDPLFTVPSPDGLEDWWVCDDCYDGWALTRMDEETEDPDA